MGGGLEADLSPGAVRALWHGAASSDIEAGYRPVLQVADVTEVPDPDGIATGIRSLLPYRHYRYRLLLSDGVHSQHAMLAPAALTHLASGGAVGLRPGSVVRLIRFFRAASVPGQDHGR